MIRRILPRLLGAACLLAVAFAALPALSRPAEDDGKPLGKLPPDLALVPRDAMFFMTFRYADLLEASAAKALLASPVNRELARFWENVGLAPEGVERVTTFFRRGDQGPVVVVRTLKPFDADALRKARGADEAIKAHGKTLHRVSAYRGPECMWAADDRTLVLADARSLVPYLATLEKPGKTHVFADELAVAAGKHTMTLAILPSLMTRFEAATYALRREKWTKPKVKEAPFGKDRPAFKDVKKDAPPPPPPPPPPRKEALKDEDGFVGFQPKDAPFKDKGDFVPRRPPVDVDGLKDEPLKLGTLEEAFDDMDRWGSPLSAPFRPALRCRRALLTADIGEEVAVSGKAWFGSEAEARDGQAVAKVALLVARDMFPMKFRAGNVDIKAKGLAEFIKAVQDSLRAAEVERDGKTVTASVKGRIDTRALAAYLAEQVPVTTDANNLRQIALAFHNLHDATGSMAQAICDKDGKPLLSWRVAILPYIEQDALYRQFRLDEPWDSAHNKKLLGKLPKLYAPVKGEAAEPDATYYQVFTGPGSLFPKPSDKVQFFRITDGSSNTFLVAESSRAVPWTKPEDMAVTEKAIPNLGGQFGKFFHAAMADGSVRKIKRNADAKLLRWAIDPSDGNVLEIDSLKP